MKKKKSNNMFKFLFTITFLFFLTIYFASSTGYYEYKNYQKSKYIDNQLKKYEEDIKNGVAIDLNEYIKKSEESYDNKLSVKASKLSNFISKLVKGGVENTFKYISKLIDE